MLTTLKNEKTDVLKCVSEELLCKHLHTGYGSN